MSIVPRPFTIPLEGPGAYPITFPRATRITTETEEWLSTDVEFDSQYSQVLLLANVGLRFIELEYQNLTTDEWAVLRGFWESVGGLEGTFPFTHPSRGWTARMRFAEDFLEWTYYDPAETRTVIVRLEEAQ
jgi:hypothetical protein